jgi:hypothetical protein
MRLLSFLALAVLMIPSSAAADEQCSGDLAALRALYEVRQMMMRASPRSHEIQRRLDYHIEQMREPLRDGGYRWVRWVRPAADGPLVKDGKLVSALHGGDWDSFEAAAPNPYSVRVAVPRKRSLTRNNNRLYVSDVEIRYWVDGEMRTMRRKIDQWMNPDTSRTFDLEAIADRAEVRINAATSEAHLRDALVEIQFRQAIWQDDPANPAFEAIQSLRRLSSSIDPVRVDTEIARFEKRLFPALRSTPYTALMVKLRETEQLLRSEKAEDQEKAKKMLTEVSRSLEQ